MEKIILYGAGERGRRIYNFFKYLKLDDYVYAFCDRRADIIKEVFDKTVLQYDEAKTIGLPFLIGVGHKYYFEVKNQLTKDRMRYYDEFADWGVQVLGLERISVNRNYCAFFHDTSMDSYFDEAEKEDSLKIFWDEKSLFYQMFQQLNLENIIELACGRGRHVLQYIDKAINITLVDILDKNIDYCKKRFAGNKKISYYKNNGYDLSDLPSNFYTALFTYDAMVHFEMWDIYII